MNRQLPPRTLHGREQPGLQTTQNFWKDHGIYLAPECNPSKTALRLDREDLLMLYGALTRVLPGADASIASSSNALRDLALAVKSMADACA